MKNRNSAGLKSLPLNVVYMKNIRRRRLSSGDLTYSPEAVWCAAGEPRVLFNGDAVPFASFSPPSVPGKIVTLWMNGSVLSVSVADELSADPLLNPSLTAIEMIAGEPLTALTDIPGRVKIMMKHAPAIYLSYDASLKFTYLGEFPALPNVEIFADDFVSLTEPVGPVKLSGMTKRGDGSLSPADAEKLGEAALKAYSNLSASALSGGMLIQPVIARCRFLDERGSTLSATLPVLLSPRGGMQCCEPLTMSSADSFSTLSSTILRAEAYRIKLKVAGALPSPWCEMVAKIVVEITPQIHPVSYDLPVPHILGVSGGTDTVKFVVPGAARSVALDNRAIHKSAVLSILDASESLLRVAGLFRQPFSGPVSVSYVYPVAESSVKSTLNMIDSVVSARAKDTTVGATCAVYPLGVDRKSYDSVAVTPGNLFLANPLVAPSSGAPLGFLSTVKAQSALMPDGEWEGYVAVGLPDSGGMAVSVDSGTSNAPGGLSPLLCYPDSRAVSMTVAVVMPGGGVRMETFPLTPLPSVGLAVFLSDGMKPFLPAEGNGDGFRIPVERTSSVGRPGVVDVCRSDCSVVDSFNAGSRIVAMASPGRNTSSWEFSREKMLLFCREGITLITVGGEDKVHSSAVIDLRGVKSSSAVCGGSSESGMAVYALAGGDLLRISSSKVTTLLSRCDAQSVGYSSVFSELWLAGGDKGLRRLTASGEMVEVDYPTLSGPDVRFVSFGGRLLLRSSSLFDAGAEVFPAKGVEVSLVCRAAPSKGVKRVDFRLLASLVEDGLFSVYGDHGCMEPRMIMKLEVKGSVDSPVSVAVASPRRSVVVVGQSGRVSGDAVVRIPSLFE